MNRRQILAALGTYGLSLAAPPVLARSRPYRIGLSINFISADERAATLDVLKAMGWDEGRDFVFVESGLPFGHEIERAAERIVAAKPDLIITVNTAYAVAVRRYTKTIPIVVAVPNAMTMLTNEKTVRHPA